MRIDTERLTIRHMAPEDWKDVQKITLDFQSSPYAVYDQWLPVEDGEIRETVRTFAAPGLFFSVSLKGNPGVIGYVCFHREKSCFDLGYCFHSSGQGKGYAYESCKALMDYLSQTRQAEAFTASTAIENVPSCRLLKKLGFVQIETESLAFHQDAAGNDIVFTGGIFRKEN